MADKSKVALAIAKKIQLPEDVVAALSDADELGETHEANYWYWEDADWRSDLKDVKCIEDFFEEMHEEDYGFIQIIGDQYTVERGSPEDFELYITRIIDKPF